MLNVTNEDLIRRWDKVPQSMREDISSDANADFIWKTCDNEHLPEEKRYDVAGITGWVLLGFLHPGDLAEEIAERLQINRPTAGTIANAINERIFAPIKKELDEIYEPPSKFGSPIPEPPRLVEEIKAAPALPPVPKTPEPPRPPSPAESPRESAPTGEFERLGMGKGQTAPEKKEVPPLVLHEENPVKPSPAASSFRFGTPTPKLSDVKMGGEAVPPKPAIVDFGSSTSLDKAQGGPPAAGGKIPTPAVREIEPPPPVPPSPRGRPEETYETYSAEKIPVANIGKPVAGKPDVNEEKSPRIVHYTEFRTPLEKPPAASDVPSGATRSGQQVPPPNIPLVENNPAAAGAKGQPSVPLGEFAKLAQRAEPPTRPPESVRTPPTPPKTPA